ncbi:hypothetical protein OSH08_02765 [Kaistia geumhonensis]|uniref:Uncharacterized protein n=1 Tax=Kaistia geumhonensis TaxID=410839 RepID=A0ABU0M7E0_9HYPH|nr:hypothetical protein [Kaistia geumhonensis]MCX5477908.1 hypothetical protein [Kaistia geumhonensis]MDQ0516879.1 hypothetical protein [Kaistia geumhonensis]
MSSRFDNDIIDRPGAAQRDPVANAPRKSTEDARQGETRNEMRYVLGFGVAGVVVAFAIIYAIFWL